MDEKKQKQTEIYEAVKAGKIEKTIAILNTGIDLEFKYKYGDTLLKTAVDYHHVEIVRLLLKAGASTISSNKYLLRQALNYALNKNDINILKELVGVGINVNQSLKNDGETAIMDAAHCGNFNVVRMLVDAGANVNAVTNGGYFALWNAANQGWREIYDYLAPLTDAELRQEAEQLLAEGLIYRQRANDKFTEAFIEAAAMGNLNAVNKAIDEGVNVNAISCENVMALNIASFWGHISVVKALIKAGANVNNKNENKSRTALVKAIDGLSTVKYLKKDTTRQIEVIHILIEAGADVNATNNDNWTALMEAVKSDNIQIVEILLKAGADINIKNLAGQTALSLAQQGGNSEIIQLLLKAGAIEN